MKYIKNFEQLSIAELINVVKKYGTNKIKQLLRYDEDVNKLYYNGNTLLIIACDYKNLYLVKDLIANGANVNIQNNNGKTALMFICSEYYSAGDLGYIYLIIKELINAGANVNLKDNDGKPTLLYCNEYESVKMLINAGADLNSKDRNGDDIFDYFFNKGTLIEKAIEKDFPEKYKNYLEIKEMENDINKYNL